MNPEQVLDTLVAQRRAFMLHVRMYVGGSYWQIEDLRFACIELTETVYDDVATYQSGRLELLRLLRCYRNCRGSEEGHGDRVLDLVAGLQITSNVIRGLRRLGRPTDRYDVLYRTNRLLLETLREEYIYWWVCSGSTLIYQSAVLEQAESTMLEPLQVLPPVPPTATTMSAGPTQDHPPVPPRRRRRPTAMAMSAGPTQVHPPVPPRRRRRTATQQLESGQPIYSPLSRSRPVDRTFQRHSRLRMSAGARPLVRQIVYPTPRREEIVHPVPWRVLPPTRQPPPPAALPSPPWRMPTPPSSSSSHPAVAGPSSGPSTHPAVAGPSSGPSTAVAAGSATAVGTNPSPGRRVWAPNAQDLLDAGRVRPDIYLDVGAYLRMMSGDNESSYDDDSD